MYKCVCGEVFDENTANWKHNDGVMACPNCFSLDYFDATKCKSCGEWFGDGEGESYICNSCLETYKFGYRYNPKKLYELTDDLTENIEINCFLASVFTQKEIEEVLLKELIIASATKLPDYINFIEEDEQAFAELVEGVIESEQKGKSEGGKN